MPVRAEFSILACVKPIATSAQRPIPGGAVLRRGRLTHSFLFAALAFFLCLGVMIPAATAKDPAEKFEGEIIISEKRFPSRFKSDAQMIAHMKKVNTHEITATGDDDWEFEYMAFLPGAVGTLQAAVTFYDITSGGQALVDTFTFYPADKSERILNGHARLDTERFKPDRKYLMIFSRGYGQRALAQTQVVLRRKGGATKEKAEKAEKAE